LRDISVLREGLFIKKLPIFDALGTTLSFPFILENVSGQTLTFEPNPPFIRTLINNKMDKKIQKIQKERQNFYIPCTFLKTHK